MATALVVNKQMQLPLFDIIRYQINMHCFINKVRISPAQQDCLAFLGLYGEMNMSDFCEQVVINNVFGNIQTTRNFVTKSIKDGLVKRSGLGNKLISLNDELKIITNGTILLNLKLFHIETNKS